MRTLKLTLQHDGTDFVGWQRQTNGVSIQELSRAGARADRGHSVAVIGAGRTDAGVHAIGQVASVQLESALDASSPLRALNATLPDAVRVTAGRSSSRFQRALCRRAKGGCYRIWNGPVVPPFERRYVWHVPQMLDLDRMREAEVLIGRHDFAAFRAAGSDVATSERTLRCLKVEAVNEKVTMVAGDGFLRHMVRAIAGTLVDVGLGRRSIDSVSAALASRIGPRPALRRRRWVCFS